MNISFRTLYLSLLQVFESIAHSIFGHKDIKRELTLSLFGREASRTWICGNEIMEVCVCVCVCVLCVYVHVMLLCDNNQKCCVQTCCPAFGSHFVLCTTHMPCGYHGYLSRTLSFFNVSQLLILCYLID